MSQPKQPWEVEYLPTGQPAKKPGGFWRGCLTVLAVVAGIVVFVSFVGAIGAAMALFAVIFILWRLLAMQK